MTTTFGKLCQNLKLSETSLVPVLLFQWPLDFSVPKFKSKNHLSFWKANSCISRASQERLLKLRLCVSVRFIRREEDADEDPEREYLIPGHSRDNCKPLWNSCLNHCKSPQIDIRWTAVAWTRDFSHLSLSLFYSAAINVTKSLARIIDCWWKDNLAKLAFSFFLLIHPISELSAVPYGRTPCWSVCFSTMSAAASNLGVRPMVLVQDLLEVQIAWCTERSVHIMWGWNVRYQTVHEQTPRF